MKKYVFESLKFFCAAILCTILSAFTTPSWAALPDGYTELQYIESTGTQYIDTGVLITQNGAPWSWQIKVNFSELPQYMGSNGNIMLMYYSSEDGFMAPGSSGIAIPYTLNTDLIAEMQLASNLRRSIVINGVTSTGSNASAFTNPIYLMGYSGASTGNLYLSKGKLYYSKIYSNGTLVQDLVPVKYTSGNTTTIGMYDTVNNRFYENAGSGSFIAGPIACDGTMVNYTSATGTVSQAGTPTPTNPIDPTFYKQGNMVLRKVGDVADSYDATTGKITRRVGVKVFDGTEDGWAEQGSSGQIFKLFISSNMLSPSSTDERNKFCLMNTYKPSESTTLNTAMSDFSWLQSEGSNAKYLFIKDSRYLHNVEGFKQYLAAQYAAGTPVTVWYPLETETTEDWTETSYCETPIKVATTKYNETKFSPLNAALANAISVVDTVVSNTITQAGKIATLQTQKQTRPDETCPAGKKCLLVTDENNVPHWYEIVTSILPDGYTELQYIESTGTQYIDTGVVLTNDVSYVANIGTTVLNIAGTTGIIWQSGSIFQIRYYSNGEFNITNGFGRYEINTLYNVGFNVDKTRFCKDDLCVTKTRDIVNNSTKIKTGVNDIIASLQIYDNGTLVRDFVPVKNADGKIGMYDLVTNTFFENKGTGEFVAGPVAE